MSPDSRLAAASQQLVAAERLILLFGLSPNQERGLRGRGTQ